MSLSYAHEKYSTGVSILAEGAGRIQERLVDAFVSQVGHATNNVDGVPPDISGRILDLHGRLTCRPARNQAEGTAQGTIGTMSEEEAVEEAKEIVAIAYELRAALEDARHSA